MVVFWGNSCNIPGLALAFFYKLVISSYIFFGFAVLSLYQGLFGKNENE